MPGTVNFFKLFPLFHQLVGLYRFGRHPIITGVVALIVIFGVIGAVSGGSKSTPSPSTNSNSNANATTQQTTQPTPVIVDATALVGEYDKNKLAAQDKYTGKRLQFTAFIENISSDITGSYYLSLKPSNDQYYTGTTIQCYFASKSQLTSLANGQSITVTGTAQDMSLGIVELKDCSVVKYVQYPKNQTLQHGYIRDGR